MSDPIDCLAFQASLSCNSGTREPAPQPVEGETKPLADERDCYEVAGEIADAVECYDGDDLLMQIIPALRPVIGELEQGRAEIARLTRELEAFKESTRLASAAMHRIIALADQCRNLATPHERCTFLGAQIEYEARNWLSPPLAALPPARVVAREEGQS